MDNINYHEKYERKKLFAGLAFIGVAALALAAAVMFPATMVVTIPLMAGTGIVGGTLALTAGEEVLESAQKSKRAKNTGLQQLDEKVEKRMIRNKWQSYR